MNGAADNHEYCISHAVLDVADAVRRRTTEEFEGGRGRLRKVYKREWWIVSAKFFVYQMCDQVKRIIVLRLILGLAERSVNKIGTQEGDILFTANYKRP